MSDAFALPVYLIRHGAVEKQSGHLPDYDAPLVREQPALDALAPFLEAEIDSTAIWHVSPLLRAQQTCERLVADTAAPTAAPLCDARLEEQNFGKWHGQPIADVWDNIAAQNGARHPASFIDADITPPGGTSFREIYDHARLFLEDLLIQKPQTPQVIISHAGIIRALLGHMMGLSASQAMMLVIAHGSLSRADYIWKNEMPEDIHPWQIQYINRVYCKTA